ncbi:MAG TPA: hypothetical protein VNI79_05070 [Sphingomicrobium sp.]|nr:hypothetical protein [Sphingomicrobium sp.]
MGLFLISLAIAATAPLAGPALRSSPASRSSGAEASARVTVRILRSSASIGSIYGPPAPLMRPRSAHITAADGSSVPALIYDFE